MYNHTLHHGKDIFVVIVYKLSVQKKCYIKDCFEINAKQRIIMLKKDKYVKFKNYKRKIKSPFMIYANFESLLVPEDNGKQNSEESYTK